MEARWCYWQCSNVVWHWHLQAQHCAKIARQVGLPIPFLAMLAIHTSRGLAGSQIYPTWFLVASLNLWKKIRLIHHDKWTIVSFSRSQISSFPSRLHGKSPSKVRMFRKPKNRYLQWIFEVFGPSTSNWVVLSPRIPLLVGAGVVSIGQLNPDTGRPAGQGLWTCLILLLFCGI